jgi:hypothetical protein
MNKWNVEEYDFYVSEFIRISNEEGHPLNYNKFSQFNIPNYRWFLKHSPKKLIGYYGFIESCGFKRSTTSSDITDDELIKLLKDYCNTSGIPRLVDLKKCGLPSSKMYTDRFGNYQKALTLAEVDLSNNRKFTKFRSVSDEVMLTVLKQYSINVKFPNSRDFRNNDELPAHQSYLNRFGSFRNALSLAGVVVPKDKEWLYTRTEYKKDELLYALDYFTKEKLKSDIYLINNTDLKNGNFNMACESVYTKNFGGIKEAYLCLDINYDEFNKKATEKDMIEQYLLLAENLGHTPNSREIDEASALGNCYSTKPYIEHFGNLINFQRQLNLKTSTGNGFWKTREEGLEDLRILYKELERIPTQFDVNACEYCASSNWYYKMYGGQYEALKEAGFKDVYETKIKITPNGNVVRSSYEYDFIRMLEEKNIKFIQEELYSVHIPDLNRKLRLDFTVLINGISYLIEIFGIMEYEWYRKKTDFKMKLCKDNNLPLIDLYKEDFLRGRKIDDLYKLLMKKIEGIDTVK